MREEKWNRLYNETWGPSNTREWIIPPHLYNYTLKDFNKLCQIIVKPSDVSFHSKKPLLIYGNTGVGKSLFVNYYISHFRKINGVECNIKRINCAQFDGDLLRAELFGYVKGSYTGAEKDHPGWIMESSNGLLILEEIGELPPPVQAKLLVFLDTGEFHRVGETTLHNSNVQIIATTNKKLTDNGIREDFWNRFFQFYIPSIYERRPDILYYFYTFNKLLLSTLTKNEIMVLLTYNWPGNVREIENFCTLLTIKDFHRTRWLKTKLDKRIFDYSYRDNLGHPLNFLVNARPVLRLLESKFKGFNKNFERYLNKIGFSKFPKEVAFNKQSIINYDEDPELKINHYTYCDSFNYYNNGLNNLCIMLLQSPQSPHPILDIKENDDINSIFEFYLTASEDSQKDWTGNGERLEMQKLIENTFKKWEAKEYQMQKQIYNFRAGMNSTNDTGFLSEKDILRDIYKSRIELLGSINKAADSLCLPRTTFRDRLKKTYPELYPLKQK